MLKRLLPMPVHSCFLWVVWVLLNDFSAGHVLLGAVLAVSIPWLTAPMIDPHPAIRKPWLAIRYILMVLWDIIVSNFVVAKQVLMPNKYLKPGFIALPLDLHEPFPLAVLASTISLTPGTVSVDFSDDMQWLYVHALNIDDETTLIAHMKQRYERPLQEMFAC
jgi:multicomponent K+:H+ antiporter subunit E